MRYINTLREGETIRNIYLCKGKRSAETRNGKPYDNLILQDKTGTLDGKVWDPNSGGIADYEEKDFIEVYGDIISYNNNLQMNIKQIRKVSEEEYQPADYMPTTEKNPEKSRKGLYFIMTTSSVKFSATRKALYISSSLSHSVNACGLFWPVNSV